MSHHVRAYTLCYLTNFNPNLLEYCLHHQMHLSIGRCAKSKVTGWLLAAFGRK